jgi:hypothetical protein
MVTSRKEVALRHAVGLVYDRLYDHKGEEKLSTGLDAAYDVIATMLMMMEDRQEVIDELHRRLEMRLEIVDNQEEVV